MCLFETQRLSVRRLDHDDLEAMYAVYSDVPAMRWVDDGQGLDRTKCEQWIEVTQNNYETRGYGMSAIELLPADTETGSAIGFCGLVHPRGQVQAELKYALLREYWSQGYATEAARGMIQYGQATFRLEEIIATVAPENLASQRVLAKAGMRHVETLQEEDGTRNELFRWSRHD